MDFGDIYGDTKFQQVQQSLPDLGSSAELWKPKDGGKNKFTDPLMNSALAAILLDAGQTSKLPNLYKDGWSEINPILGNTPSSSKINGFFAAQVLGNALMRYAPEKYQNLYSSTLLVNRIPTVLQNYKLERRYLR